MNEPRRHAYLNHPPGSYWATDEAWEILDTIEPGVISDEVRAFLVGMIAGRLMKERRRSQ